LNRRIFILTAEDPLYSAHIFEKLFVALPGEVVGVGFTGGTFTFKRVFLSPFIYGFISYVRLAILYLYYLICCGGKIKCLCRKHGVATYELASVKDGLLLGLLMKHDVNLLVSINCGLRLHSREFLYPEFGAINLHNGELPRYRGLMPILHAIRCGESDSGVTVHYIDENLDTGPVIVESRVSIGLGDDLFSVWEKSVFKGAPTLITAIDAVTDGSFTAPASQGELSQYYGFPSIRQIASYRLKLISNFLLRISRSPRP